MKRLLLSLALAGALVAQQAPPAIHSPEVHADGSVTFRLLAPGAQKVSVSVEGVKDPFPMQKDEQGVWSATSGVLAPDLYGYSFNADGAHLLDPSNTEIKPNLLGLSNLVHIAGDAPLPWDVTDVPHGVLHHHLYRSSVVGDNRDFYVYTPPGYDAAAATRYPVLYLLHGFSDDASGWTAVGKANLILDTLIAQNKIKPMIVVMPLGYGTPEILHRVPGAPAASSAALRDKNMGNFRTALIDEVIPAVERAYEVNTSREARAIAGLSMGGAESLLTGLNRPDKFSWVGAFSAGGAGEDFGASFPQLDASANEKFHLIWIACGTEDRLLEPNRKFIAWAKEKGVRLTQIETPGMHTWMVWRRNLVAFTPLLFQNEGRVVRPAIITGEK